MFTCEYCLKPTGPNVSPILVHDPNEDRPKSYTFTRYNEIEDMDETVTVAGSEITREFKQCPTCAGIAYRPVPTVDMFGNLALGLSLQAHGRSCKKPMDECKVCQRNMLTFHSLPAPVLNKILEDRRPQAASFRLSTLLVDSMLERTKHKGKRAKADFLAAYPVLKNFESRGGTA